MYSYIFLTLTPVIIFLAVIRCGKTGHTLMYQRKAALSAVIETTAKGLTWVTTLFQIKELVCLWGSVYIDVVQQISNAFAVAHIKPVPDLFPVDSSAPAHKRHLDTFRQRVHGNIAKLLPQFLQNLVTIPQGFDFRQALMDRTVIAVVKAVFLM